MKADPDVISMHQEFDALMARAVEQSTREGRPPTCGKDCPGCCFEPVYVEVREIQNALGRMTPELRKRVKDRTYAWLAKVLPSGLLNEEKPSVFAWRALHASCPFLEFGRCSIYADRPLGCRAHTAVGPKKACHDEELRKTQTYLQCEELDTAMMMLACRRWSDLEFNNLGVVLAKILCGLDIECADAQQVKLRGTECD